MVMDDARRHRAILAALQIVGGPAVLGSYVYSFQRFPDLIDGMWGGVPEGIRGIYTAWMFVAATGYLLFTWAFLFRSEPGRTRILGRGYGLLHLFYALVLFPSAAWMPLTGLLLEGPSPALWLPVKLVLWATLAGSLGLLAATLGKRPAWPAGLRVAAIAGAAGFCVQTVLLDGIVWVWLFQPPA